LLLLLPLPLQESAPVSLFPSRHTTAAEVQVSAMDTERLISHLELVSAFEYCHAHQSTRWTKPSFVSK
jgi:hypothetical protein